MCFLPLLVLYCAVVSWERCCVTIILLNFIESFIYERGRVVMEGEGVVPRNLLILTGVEVVPCVIYFLLSCIVLW